jgi:hypothetical protein
VRISKNTIKVGEYTGYPVERSIVEAEVNEDLGL